MRASIRTVGFEDIIFSMNYDVDQMLQVNAEAYNKERDISISVERLGRGMKVFICFLFWKLM